MEEGGDDKVAKNLRDCSADVFTEIGHSVLL